MTQPLLIQLTDATFAALKLQAKAAAQSPEQMVAADVERRFGQTTNGALASEPHRKRVADYFGTIVGLGSADNETIDADLAREYGDSHETP